MNQGKAATSSHFHFLGRRDWVALIADANWQKISIALNTGRVQRG